MINEALRAKARGFSKRNTERLRSIRTLKGAVLWPRMYKLKSVKEHLDSKLKDVYFRELYELEQEKMKLAKLVVDYRIKRDLTQGELANELGITQQYISKIEEGIFSNIKDVAKILLAIGYRIEIRPVHIPEKVSKRIRHKLQFA